MESRLGELHPSHLTTSMPVFSEINKYRQKKCGADVT